MNSLKKQALDGSLWTLGGYGSSQLFRLGSHLILAWLLTPQIFGLMSLVKVVQHGLNMFSDVGIKPSIIQNKRGTEPKFLNTAWTIQIARGFALWLCFSILAWPLAAIFSRNDQAAWQLIYLLPVTGFIAVLQGFESPALAILNRNLQLGRITMLELGTQLASLAVMIVWALLYPTVWAMVGGGVAAAAVKMIASHLIVPGYCVRMGWDKQCASELFKFGKWIFLSTIFTFLALNLDKLMLGNVLTLADLGIYSIALVFAKVALYVTTRLGGTVLFPVYSKFRDEPEKMISVALRAREVVLWAGAAVCLAFAVGAPLFFETLWDSRYHQAGTIAQWLTLYVWAMIVLLTMDRIPLALGNSRALFMANVWRCVGIVFAIGGYMIAQLPGFIVGLAIGPIIAHVYLLLHVPVERRAIVVQGVRFTLGMLAYGLPAILITVWIGKIADLWVQATAVMLLAGLPLLVSVLVVWNRIQGEFGKKNQCCLIVDQ